MNLLERLWPLPGDPPLNGVMFSFLLFAPPLDFLSLKYLHFRIPPSNAQGIISSQNRAPPPPSPPSWKQHRVENKVSQKYRQGNLHKKVESSAAAKKYESHDEGRYKRLKCVLPCLMESHGVKPPREVDYIQRRDGDVVFVQKRTLAESGVDYEASNREEPVAEHIAG